MPAVYYGIIIRIDHHIENIIPARHIQRRFSGKLHAGSIKLISVLILFIQEAVNFTVHVDIVHLLNNFLKSIFQIVFDGICQILRFMELFLLFRIIQNIQDNAVSQYQRYDYTENIDNDQLFLDIEVIHNVFHFSSVSTHSLPQPDT